MAISSPRSRRISASDRRTRSRDCPARSTNSTRPPAISHARRQTGRAMRGRSASCPNRSRRPAPAFRPARAISETSRTGRMRAAGVSISIVRPSTRSSDGAGGRRGVRQDADAPLAEPTAAGGTRARVERIAQAIAQQVEAREWCRSARGRARAAARAPAPWSRAHRGSSAPRTARAAPRRGRETTGRSPAPLRRRPSARTAPAAAARRSAGWCAPGCARGLAPSASCAVT